MMEDRKKADVSKAVETVLKKCGIIIPEGKRVYRRSRGRYRS